MKKIIIGALMAFVALRARAQKLEKPEIDKITGDTTMATKEQVVANKMTLVGHYLACHIARGKRFYLLSFHAKEGMNIHYYIMKGDKAIIKFTDGKLLELEAVSDEHSSLISYAEPPVAECYVSYDLTDDAIAALKNGKIAVIRIITSKGLFDYEITDGRSEIIKKQIELITSK